MANLWLNCVVRKDLNLPEGLLVAQAVHIGSTWVFDRILEGHTFTEEEKEWMKRPYVNVLAVNNREELEELLKDANRVGLQATTWTDILPSSALKRDVPNMKVGFTIGPADMDKLKEVTGNLPRF